MSSTDSWWLYFWEWFATVGFSLVIIGCVIEGVEHFVKFKRSESQKRKGIEKLGWLILVIGLAMEFLGDKRAKRIADRENRRLTVEAAQAVKDAGKANERAEELTQTNLLLQAKVFELGRQAAQISVTASNALSLSKPRQLDQEQKLKLVALLKNVPKAKFAFNLTPNVSDAIGLATDIARVIVQAGFEYLGADSYYKGGTHHGIAVSTRGNNERSFGYSIAFGNGGTYPDGTVDPRIGFP